MTRAASSQPLTVEDWIRSQVSQYGICGERKALRDVSRRVYRLVPVSTITQMLHNHVSFICHQNYIILATDNIVKQHTSHSFPSRLRVSCLYFLSFQVS